MAMASVNSRGSAKSRAPKWKTAATHERIEEIRTALNASDLSTRASLDQFIAEHHDIHDKQCLNLNPAANVMSPKAERAQAQGLSTRPSLGHPGDKYEMGLEAAEKIEVVATDLARRVFEADHAEIRMLSGAMANLTSFMAMCKPGDAIIVPPACIGGHVTHSKKGAAGLYGLKVYEAPIDADGHTVDIAGVAKLAKRVKPTMITIGTSLNLFEHPVSELREIADTHKATLLFDAAHACGLIAGKRWSNPLNHGAHIMTMSTYKSLAGPAGGLLVTNNTKIAGKVDAVAYPGLTANSDLGRVAALALTLLDWVEHGETYAIEMVTAAASLAVAMSARGLDVYTTPQGATRSHVFAMRSDDGHATAQRLRTAGLLTSAIGLPTGEGVRFGLNEAVRLGMRGEDMVQLSGLVQRALTNDPATVADDVAAFRAPFTQVQFTTD